MMHHIYSVHFYGAVKFILFLLVFIWTSPVASEPTPRAQLEEGVQAYRQGKVEDAINLWSEAARSFAAAGDRRGQLEALLRRAEAYQGLGFQGPAVKDLEICRRLTTSSDGDGLSATLNTLFSRAYASSGDPGASLDILDETIAQARRDQQWDLVAVAQNERGILLTAVGRTREAAQAFRESADLARIVDDRATVVGASLNAARIAVREGQGAEAKRWLREAHADWRRLDSGREQSTLAVAFANVWLLLSNTAPKVSPDPPPSEVYKMLHMAAAWAEEADDARTFSHSLGTMSQLYALEEMPTQALDLARRALAVAETNDEPAISYQWNWQIARLLAEAGNRDEAIAAYSRAITDVKKVKVELFTSGFASGESFREAIGPLYLEMTDLLLRRAADKNAAAAQSDLVSARSVMDEFKTAELEDYFRDECVVALEEQAVELHQLADDVAALYPILLPDRIELLLTLGDRLHRWAVPVPSDQVTEEVRALRHRLERITTNQYLPHAQRLYDWLVRPIRAELETADVRTLVFVPDGALRTIPLAALHDGRRFVAEAFATVVVPGLSLLGPPRDSGVPTGEVLVAAITESVQGYPALPAVEEEIKEITRYAEPTVLANREFDLNAFAGALRKKSYPVVHLATHGVVSSDPRRSFVLTYDGKLTLDQLETAIKASEFRTQPIELLTLSACSTAAGDDRAALGFAGIGIKAGARSAVASLWFVNDEATARLIGAFYADLLTSGLTKAEVLQHRQQAMIDDDRFGHPGYWSPFVLIGNWR